jgi:hypothetical protein
MLYVTENEFIVSTALYKFLNKNSLSGNTQNEVKIWAFSKDFLKEYFSG